jgi:hypothetical protein
LNPSHDIAVADQHRLFETQSDIVRFRAREWSIVVKADRSPPLTLRAQRSKPVNEEIIQ